MAILKSDKVKVRTFYNDKGPSSKCVCFQYQSFKIQEAQHDETKTNPVCRNPSKSTKSYENVKH